MNRKEKRLTIPEFAELINQHPQSIYMRLKRAREKTGTLQYEPPFKRFEKLGKRNYLVIIEA